MVDGTGPYPNENLAGFRAGIGNVPVSNHIQCAVLLKLECFHGVASSLNFIEREWSGQWKRVVAYPA